MKPLLSAPIAALLIPFAVAACAGEPGARAPEPVVRGSLSPSAPVQLRYRLPERAPAGVPLTMNLELTTPLRQGELLVEVAKHTGLALVGADSQSVELAGQAQPIRLPLALVPESGAERFLVLLVSVQTEAGPMSRTFRIDLPVED